MYYVYELVDPRDGAVFYVGKGKGRRISQHVKHARAGRVDNPSKFTRICEIHAAGLDVIERVLSHHQSECEAFTAERLRIALLRDSLTNCVSGVISDAERGAAMAKATLEKTKTLEEWERTITPRQRAAVEAVAGSLQAFHAGRVAFLRAVAYGTP